MSSAQQHWFARTTSRRPRRSGRFCWSEPSNSEAATGSLSGCILNPRDVRTRRLRERRAMRPQNFSVACEAEHHAYRQAFVAHIVKSNPLRRRFDFFQRECVGCKAVEARSPIGRQARPALVHRGAIAPAFETGFRRVEIPQCIKIAPPACAEPIHDDGDLVEIIGQMKRIHSGYTKLCPVNQHLNGALVRAHCGITNSVARWKFPLGQWRVAHGVRPDRKKELRRACCSPPPHSLLACMRELLTKRCATADKTAP